MIFSRKVDEINKKPGGKSHGEGKEKVVVVPATESWWSKFYKNDKKRVWLIVLATVSIIIANIFLPKEVAEKTTENPYFWAGVVALFGVHIIWGVFAPGKEMGRLEMAILYGIIFFYGLTLVFPETVSIRNSGWGIARKAVADVDKALASANDNYGKTPDVSAQQSAIVPAVYQPKTRTIEVTATEDEFTEVKIPSGVQFSIDCPDDGLAKVFHRNSQQGVVYDCAQTIEVGENLHNFRIGFSAKTEKPVHVTVRITS